MAAGSLGGLGGGPGGPGAEGAREETWEMWRRVANFPPTPEKPNQRDRLEGPAAQALPPWPCPRPRTRGSRRRAAPWLAAGRAAPVAEMVKGTAKIPSMRSGDWICPRCRSMQFAQNMHCHKCHHHKPTIATMGQAALQYYPLADQRSRGKNERHCPECHGIILGRTKGGSKIGERELI
ncbi:unnamed protein product [Prorocentrum cordatum]|uniref:RanBP2-type domain-containing protein n=1 Tax=Prorocentrum cordatum TaxID=2364126 RepID=A0ABN9SX95_9DINO|nr:unnamed protein product [Polarella glacialis]